MKSTLLLAFSTTIGFGAIAPPKVVYTTFAGTGRNSTFHGLAVNAGGFAHVAGSGSAEDGSDCGFITKLNQAGTAALWTICLPKVTEVDALALDPAGFIYALGSSKTLVGNIVHQSPSTVFKLSPNADAIVYATQVPGTMASAIILDSAGAAYIAGRTTLEFAPTRGAYLTNRSSTFAAKMDADGSLVYSTNLDMLAVWGITADRAGNAWIAGSSCPEFVGSVPLMCPSSDGTAVAIRELDAQGANILVAKTYGGGPSGFNGIHFSDSADAIVVNSSDDSVWVTGTSQSRTIPTTAGSFEPRPPPGSGKAPYAIRISSTGEIVYGTYVGQSVNGPVSSLGVDGVGNPYFALVDGSRKSTLIALSSDGGALLFSKDFSSWVQSIALDGHGGLFTGGAPVSNFMIDVCPTTAGAYQPEALSSSTVVCIGRFDIVQGGPTELFFPVNAASLLPSSLAPGELITMFGMNLPLNPVVSFDGLPAPIVSADAGRIVVVVPFGVTPAWTSLQVDEVGGYTVGVGSSAPALFTADGSGSGQLDARNEDGTVNSSDNPAKPGCMVSVFLNGAGTFVPALADGQFGPVDPPFPAPVQAISITVNAVPTNVLLAIQAPGRIAGVVRVDIQVPTDTLAGDVVVKVGVGNGDPASFLFQPKTTIAIR